MKTKIILLVFCLSAILSHGQKQITSYKDFLLENGKIIWQHVFERPEIDSTELQAKIQSTLKENTIFINISESLDAFEADIFEWTLDYKRYGGKGTMGFPTVYRDGKWSGRFVIQVKSGRYRVTAYDLEYGGFTINTSYVSGVSGSQDVNGKWDETILNKERTSFKRNMLINCDLIDKAYRDIFDFKEKKSLKSDF